ncbi:MAG: hypothetical protein NTW86_24510, partial [Candidatus Sumerlaeota bacterium]|nr:hypothetical protein [Candidatus Sumerlaeota bacterium]
MILDVYLHPRNYWKTSWICVAFALAGLLFSLSPAHHNFLGAINTHTAQWINQWIGVWPAWDRFLAVLNHGRVSEAIGTILVVAIYLIYAWTQRYWDMGRLLGYTLWMGAGILVALGLAYYLAERLESELDIRGPRYQLEEFHDLSKIHPDWAIDVKDRTSVPSRHAAVCFVVLFMAFFRKRLLALALSPLALLALGPMAIGREWPSSVVASFFWSGAVAAFLTRTPLAFVPRWLDQISFAWVEHALTFWVPSAPWRGGKMPPLPAAPAEPRIVAEGAAPPEGATLEKLIRRQIAPLLAHASDQEIRILPRAPGQADVSTPHSHARYLTGEGIEGCLVVKGAWRRRPGSRGRRRLGEFRRGGDAHDLLEMRGIAVPSVLLRRSGRMGFPPVEYQLVVEKWI